MTVNHASRRCAIAVVAGFVPVPAQADAPSVLWAAPAHSEAVNAIAFSPDGSLLASAGDDHLVKLWRAADGQPLGTLATHFDPAMALAFSPDGSLLATGSTDREIQVFRVSDGDRIYTTGGGGFVFGLAFTRDSASLWAAMGYSVNELIQFRVSDGEMSAIRRLHWGTVWSVACSTNGQYLASSGADGRVILYSAPYGEYVSDLDGHNGDVVAVEFSPDSTVLASAGEYDRQLILHNVSNRAILHSIDVGPAFLHGVAFAPGGQYVAAAGENWPVNGRINVYRVSDGALLHEYTEGTDLNVGSIAYSPNGATFAFGRSDGTLVLARSMLGCVGDLDGDATVGLGDLSLLLAHFGLTHEATPGDGDLDADSDVDLADVSIMLASFGSNCP
jgi:WD40 repeat protein